LDFNRANFDEMNNYLLELDLTLSDDVEYSWSIIKSAILNAYATALRSNLSQITYQNTNIKHQLNCIRILRKKELRSPTDCNTSRLLEAELRLSRDIAQAKSNYESKLIQDFACHNQSRIRSLRKSSDTLPPSVIYNDSIASDDTIKSSLFNKFFYSVFTTSHINTPNDDDVIDTSATKHIISISTSRDEVYRALVTVKPLE